MGAGGPGRHRRPHHAAPRARVLWPGTAVERRRGSASERGRSILMQAPAGDASRHDALPWLWLSLVVILLDQLTKYLADAHLAYQVPVPVLPFLDWTLVYNTGASFSLLSDAGGWQRWLFTALAIGVSAMLVHWLRQTPRRQLWVA